VSCGSRTDAEAVLEPAGVDKGDGTAYHPHQMRFAGGLRPTMGRPRGRRRWRISGATAAPAGPSAGIIAGNMAARVLGYAIVVHGREPKS
jgi:hypothetical protein